jgi:hypothetical protein
MRFNSVPLPNLENCGDLPSGLTKTLSIFKILSDYICVSLFPLDARVDGAVAKGHVFEP